MMYLTYFVHGTTTDNEAGKATGWLPGELSLLGVQQSKELARLTTEKTFDAVFCSDLKRAVDSARLAFGGRYDIIQDKRLREANYGKWNGQPDHFKHDLERYISTGFPNGESYHDVERRVADLLAFLKVRYDGKRVAIVAHQAPQLALEVLCNKKSWPEAIQSDWRRSGQWQPGWEYALY